MIAGFAGVKPETASACGPVDCACCSCGVASTAVAGIDDDLELDRMLEDATLLVDHMGGRSDRMRLQETDEAQGPAGREDCEHLVRRLLRSRGVACARHYGHRSNKRKRCRYSDRT